MYGEVNINQFKIDINRYGFLNQTDTQLSFDGTNLFTLSAINTSWAYYRAGIKCNITGNKTVTLPGTPVTTGRYFIYIDSVDGTLIQSTSPWSLNDTKVPVAIVYFNNTLTPKYIIANERHQCLIDRRQHLKDHSTLGTVYSGGGLLTGYTLNTPTDLGNTFGISQATIFDEDLQLVLSALTDVNGASAVYQILYRLTASTWGWALSDMPFYYTGAGAPYSYLSYDNAGTLTASVNNRYVNYYIILTDTVATGEATQGTSTNPMRFAIIPGRGSFGSTTLAYAESFGSFDMTGYPIAEGVAVWQITFDTGGVANTVKGRCQINRVQRISVNVIQSTAVITEVQPEYRTGTLTTGGWSANQQALSIVGVTTTNHITVAPGVTRANFLAYGNAQISAISQTTDSITFECTTTPVVDITVDVKIEP